MATTSDEHKQQEREYADAHAESYIMEMHQGPWPLYRARMQERLFRHRARLPRVIDVGCGPIPSLLDVYEGAERYVSVDQSPECLRRLHEGYPRAETFCGDAEALAVSGPFDLAVLLGVLHHLPAPERVVARIWDLLEPGGLVAAMEPNEDAEPFMDSPNEQGIPDARFEDLYRRFETLERWHWVDTRFWTETLVKLPIPERPRLWADPQHWFAALEEEREVLRQPGRRGSMNFLIARKLT